MKKISLTLIIMFILILTILIVSIFWLGGKFGMVGYVIDTIQPDEAHLAYKNTEKNNANSATTGEKTQYTSAENTNASTSDNIYVILNPTADSSKWHSHHFTFNLSNYTINNILNITYTFEGKHNGTWTTTPYLVYYADDGWTQPSPAQNLDTSDQTFTHTLDTSPGNASEYLDDVNLFHLSIVGQDSGNQDNEIYADYIKLEISADNLPSVTALNYPSDNSWVNSIPIDFNFTVEDDFGFSNCTLYGNWSIGWHANTTITSINNGATTNITLDSIADGTYIWNILCYDNAAISQLDWFDSNYTVNIDTINPSMQFVNPTTDTGSFNQNYIKANVSASDNNLDTITINLYNSTSLFQSNSSSTSPLSIDFTSLADGTYYLNATVNDSAGNTNQTGNRTITLDTTATPASGDGGGGGGCRYKWDCTEWSECLPSGKQTRNCANIGTCSDRHKTPETEQDCTYTTPEVEATAPETKEALFDITIDLIESEINLEEDLSAKISLTGFGVEKINISLNYTILDSEDNVILTEQETLEVEAQTEFIKKFKLPQEIGVGEYKLVVDLTYPGQETKAVSESSFMITEKGKILSAKVKMFGWIGLVVLFLGSLSIYLLLKKRKKKLKRGFGKKKVMKKKFSKKSRQKKFGERRLKKQTEKEVAIIKKDIAKKEEKIEKYKITQKQADKEITQIKEGIGEIKKKLNKRGYK